MDGLIEEAQGIIFGLLTAYIPDEDDAAIAANEIAMLLARSGLLNRSLVDPHRDASTTVRYIGGSQ